MCKGVVLFGNSTTSWSGKIGIVAGSVKAAADPDWDAPDVAAPYAGAPEPVTHTTAMNANAHRVRCDFLTG